MYFMTDKRLLHWSNIVGASHSKKYMIWQYGDYSSRSVKEVCEFGYTRTMEEEMRTHVSNNPARHSADAGSMLGKRRRRWPKIEETFDQYVVFG